MVRKSLGSDFDVVVIDFEDAVSPANKEQARETAETVLSEIEDVTPQIWIRINQSETGGTRDIAAIDSVETMPDEIVLPMVNSSTNVQELETALDSHGIDSGIVGILETATGVHRVDDIVERDSLSAVIFGAEDFTTDMGIVELQDRRYLDYVQSRIAIAAVSAGINAIDTVYTDIEDTEGLRADAERALNFGFDGKVAIHPAQVDIIEDVFTPSEAGGNRPLGGVVRVTWRGST